MVFRTALVLAGIVAGLGLVGGCGGGGDSRLDVLELEQLASFVAPGGTIEPAGEAGDGEISRVFASTTRQPLRRGGKPRSTPRPRVAGR